MAYNDHYKEVFHSSVLELAGSQQRPILPSLISRTNEGGEVVYLDGISPDDDANTTAFGSTVSREQYEAAGTGEFSDWVALQTPHMDVSKQRTLCTPSLIEWGHTFKNESKIAELADPQSRTMRMAMSRIWKSEDALVLAALSAATVTRGRNSGNTSSVALAAAQKMTIDAVGSSEKVDKDFFADLVVKFQNNWIENERIFLVMSPRSRGELIKQSGGTIMSKDFVEPARYFEKGELPDIYGVHVIVHPALTVASGSDELMYAFTEFGLTWNQFAPFETALGRVLEQRNSWMAYLSEYAGCVRVDDSRVVQITIDNTSGS